MRIVNINKYDLIEDGFHNIYFIEGDNLYLLKYNNESIINFQIPPTINHLIFNYNYGLENIKNLKIPFGINIVLCFSNLNGEYDWFLIKQYYKYSINKELEIIDEEAYLTQDEIVDFVNSQNFKNFNN